VLGVDLKGIGFSKGAMLRDADLTLKYCAEADCPSNVPYLVGADLCFRPTLVEAPANEKTRCGECGEILMQCCPDADCGAEAVEGGFCRRCGARYVPVTVEPGKPVKQWIDRRRNSIRELRSLTRTERHTDTVRRRPATGREDGEDNAGIDSN
jgi:hypothetical protein